MLHIIIIASDH